MDNMGKSLALILILIVAISSLSLMMIKPAFAQTPSTPVFNVSTTSGSYVVPTTYSNNQYTGANVTNVGYTVTTFNVTITVQNAPLTTAYLLEVKGHYSSSWYNPTIDDYNITAFVSSGSQTVINLYGSNESEAPPNQIFLQYGGHWGINVPFGGKLDFRLQSISGSIGARVFGGWIYVGNASDWSAVKTVTIPTFNLASASPSPTPTVPEFPSLIILPLLITMLFVAVILRLKPKLLRPFKD